jgi:hypothetical protein
MRAAALMTFAISVGAGCVGPVESPSRAGPQPIADADAALVAASRVAEIAGPFKPIEIVSGRFDDLDPESHNAPSDPAAPARWQALADHQVWRVTFEGPRGSESAVLDATTGELLAAVIQGQ